MTADLRTAGPGTEARAGEPAARSRDLREASRRFDEALIAARREGRGAPAVPDHGSLAAAGPRRPEQPPRDAVRADPLHGASISALVLGSAPDSSVCTVSPAPAAALRAIVRTLPAAIEAARLHDGARLTLALGGALGVDLRGGAAGVEVTLRPAAALVQAVASELPALVAALRERGVRVARADLAAGAARPTRSPGRQPR